MHNLPGSGRPPRVRGSGLATAAASSHQRISEITSKRCPWIPRSQGRFLAWWVLAMKDGSAGDPAPVHPEQYPASDLQGVRGTGQSGQKTFFLCRYLHSGALRREIHEGLNVVEPWSGAYEFVFFARRGEFSSNRRENHEVTMLCLHLLQNCMVYVNTLKFQQVLAQPQSAGQAHAEGSRRPDALGLGAREPLRPLRSRHEHPVTARLIP
jgi:Tn3 transposase DDE domain